MSNEKGRVKANVLIDLDALLDTRLPVLFAIHRETAISMVADESYHTRVKDVFGPVSEDVFHTYYKNRSKNVLALATATPMIELLVEYCIEAYELLADDKEKHPPTLFINTYPYELSQDECSEIVHVLRYTLPINMDIDMIRCSNKELTPAFINDKVLACIKYDMLEWLEYHNAIGELTKKCLDDVTCVAPMIIHGNKKTKDVKQEDFDDVRAALGHITNLVFIQTRLFSSAM